MTDNTKTSVCPEMRSKEELLKTVTAYERVMEDHNRLARDLDVLINGKNPATQASLCDLVAQLRKILK